MNGKQRVIAAMEHRPVDRVPMFPVVTNYIGSRVLGCKVVDTILDPMLTFEGTAAIVQRFGSDGIEVGMGPASNWREYQRVVEIDGERFLAHVGSGEPYARLQENDYPMPLSTEPPMQQKSDLDKIAVTPAQHYIDAGCMEAAREMVRRIGDSVFLAGLSANQTMNMLVGWRGSDQAMYDLIDDPEFVLAVMERATDISIEMGKAFISTGVDAIYIGDAWASASIISPKQYERFCQPFHARAARAFQELGVKVYLHVCGKSSPILEMMADTGVDAIEPLDQMDLDDLRDAKKRVGDRVCLKGGISTLTLLNASADEVYQLCVDAIRICGPTGYILGSGDDIPRDTPFENIDAMLRAAEDCAF